MRDSGLLRLKIEKVYDRDFGAEKKVRQREDSDFMRVRFRGVPLYSENEKLFVEIRH